MACVTVSGTTTSSTRSILFNHSVSSTKPIPKPKSTRSSISFSASSFPFVSIKTRTRTRVRLMAAPTENAETTTIEKFGIKIVRNAPESQLTELGVREWQQWECPPSKFRCVYEVKEISYVVKGRAKVLLDGTNEPFEIVAGDLVFFPKFILCHWDVLEDLHKYFKFSWN